jgi:transposase
MKLLLWDRTGFWLFYKRLEQGTFQLPTPLSGHTSLQLRYDELMMILEGIDLTSIKRRRRYHHPPPPA